MTNINWKKEIYTIPNMLSLFRLILIPVYIYIYLNASEPRHYLLAAMILAVSCLTDLIDGKIARRFNMISNLGKILDPVADKATQFALLLCLASHNKKLRLLLALFITKETFQLVAGIISMAKHKMLDGALLSGKVCTTVLFISLITLVLLPNIKPVISDILILLCALFMAFAFLDYIHVYLGKKTPLNDTEE